MNKPVKRQKFRFTRLMKRSDGRWVVLEKATNYVMGTLRSKTEAEDFCRVEEARFKKLENDDKLRERRLRDFIKKKDNNMSIEQQMIHCIKAIWLSIRVDCLKLSGGTIDWNTHVLDAEEVQDFILDRLYHNKHLLFSDNQELVDYWEGLTFSEQQSLVEDLVPPRQDHYGCDTELDT